MAGYDGDLMGFVTQGSATIVKIRNKKGLTLNARKSLVMKDAEAMMPYRSKASSP